MIAATAPESHYVLDGILGNQTDLPVTEHATDTHGATLANFALFDLVGLQLSPRIRDLGKITLYRTGPEGGLRGPLPVRRAPAHPPAERRPDHGHVGRPAAGRRLRQGRARHRRPGGRQTVLLQAAAERPRRRDQGVRRAAPHRLRRPLSRGRDLPAADRPPAEQGREPARAASGNSPTRTRARSAAGTTSSRRSRCGA